ncbi:MAG: helix-turn-helix domain-containing protein [Pirellulaceae bacterium]|nr:helix-turn-helix domain-containing protein [Pirellulaceae bacterium]
MVSSTDMAKLASLVAEQFASLVAEQVAEQVLEKLEGRGQQRLGYSECQAAKMLGIMPYQLRDARLRKEISASRIGRTVVYQPSELQRFLEQQEL